MDLHGKCLCGQIKININVEHIKVGACHCNMCRKWGGGPFMAMHYNGPLIFTGNEHITTYNSSSWAERGFCKHCGSHLFYRLKETTDYYLPVGLFDDATDVLFESQVYIDKKPDYYSFANQTITLTEADIIDMVNSQSE